MNIQKEDFIKLKPTIASLIDALVLKHKLGAVQWASVVGSIVYGQNPMGAADVDLLVSVDNPALNQATNLSARAGGVLIEIQVIGQHKITEMLLEQKMFFIEASFAPLECRVIEKMPVKKDSDKSCLFQTNAPVLVSNTLTECLSTIKRAQKASLEGDEAKAHKLYWHAVRVKDFCNYLLSNKDNNDNVLLQEEFFKCANDSFILDTASLEQKAHTSVLQLEQRLKMTPITRNKKR